MVKETGTNPTAAEKEDIKRSEEIFDKKESASLSQPSSSTLDLTQDA